VTLELDERYGRTRGSASRTRLIAIVVGAAFAVVLVAWVVWGGLLAPDAELNVEDTGHVVVDETTVDVRFQLTVEPGTATRCAVQALNAGFSIVGWKIVDVPASDERIRALVETVHTTELGVTGLIYRCWLA
jgi:hypothetical protein